MCKSKQSPLWVQSGSDTYTLLTFPRRSTSAADSTDSGSWWSCWWCSFCHGDSCKPYFSGRCDERIPSVTRGWSRKDVTKALFHLKHYFLWGNQLSVTSRENVCINIIILFIVRSLQYELYVWWACSEVGPQLRHVTLQPSQALTP